MILLLLTISSVDCYAATISDAWREVDSSNYDKAEEILVNILLENPNSVDELFLLARVYGWNKKYRKAEKYLELLVSRYPNNVDYILSSAKIFYWQDKFPEALALIEKGRIISPAYNEIIVLEKRVLEAKENDERKKVNMSKGKSFVSNSEDSLMQYEVEHSPLSKNWFTSIEYEVESLDNNTPDWKNYFIGISRSLDVKQRVGVSAARIERFGLVDNQMTINAMLGINDYLHASSSYSMSQESEFIPQWMLDSSLGFNISREFSIMPRIKYSEYTSLNTLMLSAGIDKYFSNMEVVYAAFTTYTDFKTPVSSHEFKFYYHYGDGKFVSIAANVGKELLVTTAIDPIYQDVYGFRLSGKHSLTEYFGLTYLISFHQQGDSYSKQGVRLGVFVKH